MNAMAATVGNREVWAWNDGIDRGAVEELEPGIRVTYWSFDGDTEDEGERYLVAMLGSEANWVRNVRADDGAAVLRHGRRERVRLEEIEPGQRAPILQRYLQVAPGARAHFPVDRHAVPFLARTVAIILNLHSFGQLAGRCRPRP